MTSSCSCISKSRSVCLLITGILSVAEARLLYIPKRPASASVPTVIMSTKANTSASLLRGKTVRKNGVAPGSNPARQHITQVPATSGIVYGGGVKDPSGRTTEYFSMDDKCPVCKSDRYLNPKLRLLVSSCYHKMCESCIDRLYTLGPAPCPICNKVLRKLAFIPQTFEDLEVEKEVAIRRRISRIYNKRREDFEDLRLFNNYLEEVEDITFNLINGIDLAETEARVQAYKAENAAIMEANAAREAAYAQQLKEAEEAARKEREQHAAEARRLAEAEREEREREEREIIDKLESSTDKDAARLVAQSRRDSRRALMHVHTSHSRGSEGKRPAVVVVDPPHVPFTDNVYTYDDLYTLKEDYNDPASEAVRRDREGIMRAGGYMVSQAWERALTSALAGLDIAPLGEANAKPPSDQQLAVNA